MKYVGPVWWAYDEEEREYGFFPFFRVFFMGLKNEREGNIVFKKFNRLNATFDLPTDFCKDGEKASIDGNIAVEFERTECRLNLML